MLNPASPLPLKDPTLLRQANYIDGKWVEADSGQTLVVKNPATGEPIGEVPAMGDSGNPPRHRGRGQRAYPAWRAMLAKERAAILRKLSDLMLANTEDLAIIMTAEQGKPLTESKGEIAYAASFIDWFAEEGQARLRRHHSAERQGPPHPGAEGADRRVRRHHAVELPRGDDHAQGGSRLGGGLHGRDPAGIADAVLGARTGRAGGACGHAPWRVQRHHRPIRRDRARN